MNRHRITLSLLVLVLGLGLAVTGCGGSDDNGGEAAAPATTEQSGGGGGTTLNGTVGPGFDISIDAADGLSAGSYTLVVDDKASNHNFHLTGPGGIDVATDVGAEGEESFELELMAGEYKFLCDPHASQMNGSFTVG